MGEERPLEDTRGVLLLFSARLQKLPLGGGRGGGDSPMTKPNKRFLCNECGDCGRIPHPPSATCSLFRHFASFPAVPSLIRVSLRLLLLLLGSKGTTSSFPFLSSTVSSFRHPPLRGQTTQTRVPIPPLPCSFWVWRALGLHPFIFAANNIYCNKAGKEKREESFLVINPSFFSAAAAKASLFLFSASNISQGGKRKAGVIVPQKRGEIRRCFLQHSIAW